MSGRPGPPALSRHASTVGAALFGVLGLTLALHPDLEPVPLGGTGSGPVSEAPAGGGFRPGAPATDGPVDPELIGLRERARALEREVERARPRGRYVVVDRSNNRLYLRAGDAVLLEAVVSTGSGSVLRESGGQGRTWTFDTPTGRFRVLNERRNPVWTKPDWAYLEVGEAPPRSVEARRERGVLGDWALDLGDGYMIHGTLYERLLGRSITHGCIRVGRDDLRELAAAVSPGTPVFIY